MGVTVSNPPVQPAILLNQVNMTELRVLIPEAQVAKAQVRIVYSLFGVDENGVRHYSPDKKTLTVEDAFVAAQHIPALAQALVGIEAGVAALLTAQGPHGEATVI